MVHHTSPKISYATRNNRKYQDLLLNLAICPVISSRSTHRSQSHSSSLSPSTPKQRALPRWRGEHINGDPARQGEGKLEMRCGPTDRGTHDTESSSAADQARVALAEIHGRLAWKTPFAVEHLPERSGLASLSHRTKIFQKFGVDVFFPPFRAGTYYFPEERPPLVPPFQT